MVIGICAIKVLKIFDKNVTVLLTGMKRLSFLILEKIGISEVKLKPLPHHVPPSDLIRIYIRCHLADTEPAEAQNVENKRVCYFAQRFYIFVGLLNVLYHRHTNQFC